MLTGQEERAPAVRVAEFPSEPPDPVARPLLLHDWSELCLVHWRFPAQEVQALLPSGLKVDICDGSAWVGLVPFHCTIRPRGVPRVPWACSFPEMNVRTYVRGPNGEPAIWFISLEAARLGAVLIARSVYGLKYFWSKMAFSRVGNVATYEARRRWPGARGPRGSLAIAIGEAVGAEELGEIDRWLMNRWRFYCASPVGLVTGLVAHHPWPLRRARLLHCDPSLVTACGLSKPAGIPLVHYGGEVDVRMTRPYLVQKRESCLGAMSPAT